MMHAHLFVSQPSAALLQPPLCQLWKHVSQCELHCPHCSSYNLLCSTLDEPRLLLVDCQLMLPSPELNYLKGLAMGSPDFQIQLSGACASCLSV